MRFAAVQFDIAWEDKPANHATIERMLDEVSVEAGTFVLLPELGDTGFSFNLDRIVDDQSLDWACLFASRKRIWMQAGYATRGPDGRGRNCATIIDPAGRARCTYEKIHPFSYGREIEHFSGGDHLTLCDIRDADQHNKGALVSPLICYDLRFPEVWRLAARAGAEIFTIGASWPASRQHHWRTLLIARAIENQAYVVAVNRIGRDPKIEYEGGSIIINPRGEVIAEAGDEPIVLEAELDVPTLREWRNTFPALRDIHDDLLGEAAIERA